MTDRVAIRRLATGVPGLDQILGGGLPEFSFNLIAGAPGAGKTTLAQQIMFALAGPDRPALYFTVVGEPPLKMLRYQQQFSFFDVPQGAGHEDAWTGAHSRAAHLPHHRRWCAGVPPSHRRTGGEVEARRDRREGHA